MEVTIVDSKSGTGLYSCGRAGLGGYHGHVSYGSHGGRSGYSGKGTKNHSCTYCSNDNYTTKDCW